MAKVKSIGIFCQILILLSSLLFPTSLLSQSAVKTLTILNWSEYIDPDVIKGFELRYAATVKESYFESDGLRDQIMLNSEGKGFDLVMSNGVTVSTYAHLGWLESIPKDSIPNLKHIDTYWATSFEASENYAVPYFWGTSGIAYRRDKTSTPIDSWAKLMKPEDALKGRILMIEDSSELIGAALKALGYSLNSTDSEQLNQAAELLMQQKKFVKEYATLTLGDDSPIVTGEVWAAMTYNGDALMVKEFNDDIEYVLPAEGGAVWVDYFTVLSSSKNKALAYQFLDYINDPEINAQNAQYVYSATPNKSAEAFLPAEFLQNPVIYPAKSALTNFESYKALPGRVVRKRNNIFSRILQ